MLVDAGKVVTRVNHLLPDVAGRHVPPNILLIYERALAGDKQSLTSVLIADTSSFLDTGMNLENCEKVGSAMRATYISFLPQKVFRTPPSNKPCATSFLP